MWPIISKLTGFKYLSLAIYHQCASCKSYGRLSPFLVHSLDKCSAIAAAVGIVGIVELLLSSVFRSYQLVL